MTETATEPQVETPAPEAAAPAESRMSQIEFARRFNSVCRQTAKYDTVSDGSKLEPPVAVVVGETVPASRKHIAAYCGLSYNALIAREKAARKDGVNLATLAKGKRGKSANVADINKALAEDATAAEMADQASK